jgi:hypothetical protein
MILQTFESKDDLRPKRKPFAMIATHNKLENNGQDHKCSNDKFLMDSGADCHLVNNISLLSNVKPTPPGFQI